MSAKAIAKSVIRSLPLSMQRCILRRYLVREICADRRRREGEIDYLPNVVHPGDVVWDIGANVGEYTFQLSRLVGPTGQVIAFEPIAYNMETLHATIKRGRLSNVITHKMAISDRSGYAKMKFPSLYEHSLGNFSDTGESVAVSSIDELIASGFPTPAFIKCDVEGTAPAVVRGGARLIQENRPIWLMEVWENAEITQMESLGYTCYRYAFRGGPTQIVHRREGNTSTYFFLPNV